FFLRRYGIFDRIFDERLKQKRGQSRARDRGIDLKMRAQPVFETHLLDVEIKLQRLDLLRQRHLRGRLVGKRIAQEGGKAREHRVRRLRLFQEHERRDAVERVEQEVRIELIAQHRKLG